MRGGSYVHAARDIRAADRYSFLADTQDEYIGFRVARSNASEPTPLALEWVDIPAGEFHMGNNARHFHDLALPNEYPSHVVSLAEFSISRTPVTNAEYDTFVCTAHYPPPAHWINRDVPSGK